MTAYVLMTALPPTTGHLDLIRFASQIDDQVVVMLTTQPDEPFVEQRVKAVQEGVWSIRASRRAKSIEVRHYSRPMDPDPESEGFRARWAGIMIGAGAEPGDKLVISETWGGWLAELTGMDWRPYDVKREINPVKATSVRNDPYYNWEDILPEFRQNLQARITIFGAESTGKTTLTKKLTYRVDGSIGLPEYARGYLETVRNEIDRNSMTAIWEGQEALQRQSWDEYPIVIQDTDLWSTWGYWKHFAARMEYGDDPSRFPGGRYPTPAGPPAALYGAAMELTSDLYIITPSAIPFEPDPLRYGGDHRELETDYWIDLASTYHLPWVALPRDTEDWVDLAIDMIGEESDKKFAKIKYDRHGY